MRTKSSVVDSMKTILILLVGSFLLTGCMSSHYDITLNNGTKISGVSKPKLDKDAGVYRFKTVDGKEQFIPAGRVVGIEAK